VILELFIPTFAILWFGLSALVVGGLLFVFPQLALTYQLLLWSVGSILVVILWFAYLNPKRKSRTLATHGRDALIGEMDTYM